MTLISHRAWRYYLGHVRADPGQGVLCFVPSHSSGPWPQCTDAYAGQKQRARVSDREELSFSRQSVSLQADSTLTKIRYRQRFVMESQTGMSPKLSPEPLKMSLPSINCHDSKTNGCSLSPCSSFLLLLSQDPPMALSPSLHTPSAAPFSPSQGTLRVC